MESKKCSKCGVEKPVEEFGKNRSTKDGLSFYCRPCKSKSDAASHVKHREERLKKRKEWAENNKERKREMDRVWRRSNRWVNKLSNAKARCRRDGLEFDLTLEELEIPERCPLLGIKLGWGTNNRPEDYSYSLDRKDPTKGYTKDNVVIISNRDNRMKSDASIEERETLVKNLKELL